MSTKISIGMIIALFAVIMMVLVLGGFYSQILSGPELKATKEVANMLNTVCSQKEPFTTTFNIYLPDYRQRYSHKEYFYLAVDTVKFKLYLQAKREANDWPTAFTDFVFRRPGERTVQEIELTECKDKDIDICWIDADQKDPTCTSFQFESNEGKESLNFNISKPLPNRVVLEYTREASANA